MIAKQGQIYGGGGWAMLPPRLNGFVKNAVYLNQVTVVGLYFLNCTAKKLLNQHRIS